MKKTNFYIAIGVFGIILIAVFGYFFGVQKYQHEDIERRDNGGNVILTNGVVACENMRCFEEKLKDCLPATIDLSGSMSLSMKIFGLEGEKCHYEMRVGQKAGKACFFARDGLSADLLKQLFGENVGLEKVVKESCRSI
jgi:hypothetical protein